MHKKLSGNHISVTPVDYINFLNIFYCLTVSYMYVINVLRYSTAFPSIVSPLTHLGPVPQYINSLWIMRHSTFQNGGQKGCNLKLWENAECISVSWKKTKGRKNISFMIMYHFLSSENFKT